ncbi:MAG: hypothetical protein FVQ82_05815 [Planctomycetes bacterium]|nr:hypothetical protein [Planctomycetota bacterium]
MGLAIKNNIMASNAARHLGKSFGALASSVERLSSGLRINSAKDDAAGLAVRELMRADIAVLQQGARNASDGISMLQTMEGAMAVMDENLIRMKELAEQAATGSYSVAQRSIMNNEFAEMADEIERIASSTAFNGITMLNSNTGIVDIHVGTTATIEVSKVDMTKNGLNIATGNGEWGAITDNAAAYADTGTTTVLTTGTTNDFIVELDFLGATNQQVISVNFGQSASMTLEDVMDTINAASQNPSNMYDADGNKLGYAAASIYTNAAGTYQLEIKARDAIATSMSFTVETTGGVVSALAGIFGTTTTDGEDLMGANLFESMDTDGAWAADTAGGATAGLNILTETSAVSALLTVGSAIATKDESRAAFGYKMNRLESTQSVLNIQAENLMTAESRISDVDVATEMATMTRNQVLSQAGVAMLSQANTMPQMALSLLR